jgi:hypothetical protein
VATASTVVSGLPRVLAGHSVGLTVIPNPVSINHDPNLEKRPRRAGDGDDCVRGKRQQAGSAQTSCHAGRGNDGLWAGNKSEIVQADPPVLATLDAVLADESTAPSPLPEAPSPVPEPTTWPARLPPMTVPPSERDEIKQRLANFKAHQLRLQTERETYCSQTMARTRDLAARLRPTKDR